MTSFNEIMNRDHRTTQSFRKCVRSCIDIPAQLRLSNKNYSEILMQKCDDCQAEMKTKRSNLFAKSNRNFMKLSSYYLVISLSVYIMSSSHADASPIPSTISSGASPGHDETDKINFLNLQCHVTNKNNKLSSPSLSDHDLHTRLRAVLLACSSALYKTKAMTDYYIKQLWGQEVTVNGHHGTWEHKNIPWLWPENKPLPKKFRGEIHASHLHELQKTDWTREKIFEYLGKIYQRFQRIGVGVQIVNKWNDLASMEGTTLLNTEQVNISTRLFKNATEGIHEVLCEIQSIFLDMAIDPRSDLDITPFVLDKFIKLNHWLVYREYENLMDYSHKLLRIMTDDKKSGK